MNADQMHQAYREHRAKVTTSKVEWVPLLWHEPVTEAEKNVLLLLPDYKERHLLHIYEVLELMEKAYEAGKKSSSRGSDRGSV